MIKHSIKSSLLVASLALVPFAQADTGARQTKSPWSFSYEYLDLKPLDSDSNLDNQERELAHRLQVAYEFNGGLGLRANYFDFGSLDHPTEDRLSITTFDLEVFDQFKLNTLEGEWFVGIRVANLKEGDLNNIGEDLNSIGLTAGFEFIQPLTTNFAFYTKTRATILNGDDEAEDSDDRAYNTAFTYEIGAGLQYTFSPQGTIRLGAEMQHWGDVLDVEEGAGVIGLGLQVKYNF